MRLTDVAIRKLKLLETGQKIYRDDLLPGFGIRVSKKSKTFVVMYGTKRRLKTIGRYPLISLADARQEAKAILLYTPEPTSNIKFTEAVAIFLRECENHNRPETIRGYTGYLGHLDYTGKLVDLTRTKMKQHFTRYNGKPSGYNHALAVFRIFFNYSIRQEWIDRSPIFGERAIKLPSRERVLTPDEIRQVWEYEHHPFSTIVKLLMLTGQRRSEIGSIQLEWINGYTLTFPKEVVKNKRTHNFPLTDWTRELLKYVPFGYGRCYNGWANGKRRIEEKVNIDHWRLHDLRRTYATIHAEIGTPIHITEKLLNHATGSISGIVAVYNRYSYMDEMRSAQERYEAHLSKIIQRS